MKLKKGDNVIIITGKDKGKSGHIVHVLAKENKVIIEGLNMMKKHQRPRKSNEKGTMVNMAMPIHVSNVMLLEGKKGVRVGKKKIGDKLVRVSRKTGKEI